MKDHPDKTLEDSKLSDTNIKALGKQITNIRTNLRLKALEFEKEEETSTKAEGDVTSVNNLAAKMHRGYFKSKVLNPEEVDYIPSNTPVLHRTIHKSKRLSLKEKMEVIHGVLVRHEFQAHIAKQYRVKPVVVSVLVNKAKK